MRPRLSLAGQFLALQLCIVLLVVGVVAAVSIAEADATFRLDEGDRLSDVAEYVAADDTVRLLLNDARARDFQAGIAERSRAFSGAEFVVLVDSTGVALTGTDAGRPAVLGPSHVLEGKPWKGVTALPDKALVAHVPVIDGNGHVVGAVIAGKTYPLGRAARQRLATAHVPLIGIFWACSATTAGPPGEAPDARPGAA
jgi:sensor histidine kinase regulating citrate/malate metabolism